MTFSGALEQLLQLVAAVLGLTAMPDLSAMEIAVLTLAVAVLAVATLALAITLGFVQAGQGSSPHPLRAIGASVLLAQSDPAADGHPRPRAPGAARAV